jgi:peptide/nickel transport system substrate-binding protein
MRPDGADQDDTGLTRADMLKRMGTFGALIGVGDLIAACGGASKSNPASGTTPVHGKPQRGGHLRVGLLGNGPAETMNPGLGVSIIDAARMYNHYDGLVWVNQKNKVVPYLATEWSASSDAMLWRIKLRQGVTWHDGKPFTADDVIYTFRAWGSKSNFAHPSAVVMDLKALKKVNDHELAVPLLTPNGHLMDLMSYFNQMIIQDGEKSFRKPVGTGPFMLKSFTPGQRSMSVRNPNYWQSGKPYVDSLEIIAITDDGARVNALRGGQVDLIGGLPYADGRAALKSGDKSITVLTGPTPSFYNFYMGCRTAPFNDVRVRQAMMWAIDRKGLIDGAFDGFGSVGNDIPGKGLQFFDTGLPQKVQDIEKAKSLLKAAGHDTLPVTLTTATGSPGQQQAAQVLAQQVAPAGFKVKIKQIQGAAYSTPPPAGVYGTLAFAQDSWPISSLQAFYTQTLLPGGPYNETQFHDPKFTKIVNQAIATADDAKAAELWAEAQKIQYDQGGNLIYSQTDWLDASSPKVAGLVEGGPFDLGGFSFWDVYFTNA